MEKDGLIMDSAGLRLKVKWSDVKRMVLRREQAYEGSAYI